MKIELEVTDREMADIETALQSYRFRRRGEIRELHNEQAMAVTMNDAKQVRVLQAEIKNINEEMDSVDGFMDKLAEACLATSS